MKTNLSFLAIIAVTILSACQFNGQASAPGNSERNKVQGPSDGGGGDTCNGKMIESYHVDITTLDEYKEFVQPLLSKMAQEKNGQKDSSPFSIAPRMKNWYIIDCKLGKIPQERKGLYLETYQTAIQTSREIFIDAKSYGAMAKEEKAKLLLHEMVMGFYLMKYLSLEEICSAAGGCTGDIHMASKWKMYRPQVYTPLNDSDHQKIRKVTAWIWEQGDTFNKTNFAELLKNNGFDQRFENKEDSGPNNEQVQVSIEALLRMFKKHHWAKTFPQFCQFDADTNLSKDRCVTELVADIRDYSVGKMKALSLKIKVTRESDKKVIEHSFEFPITADDKKINLYTTKLGEFVKAAPFMMMGTDWPNAGQKALVEGMTSHRAMFYLNISDLNEPEIFMANIESLVWYQFEEVVEEHSGFKMKTTYGYNTVVPEESITLFTENELPFVLKWIKQARDFIRSEPVQ